MTALYELQAEFLPGPTPVVRFEGVEALNTPYVFRVRTRPRGRGRAGDRFLRRHGQERPARRQRPRRRPARRHQRNRRGARACRGYRREPALASARGAAGVAARSRRAQSRLRREVVAGHPDRDADRRRSRLDGLRPPPRRQLSAAPSRLPVPRNAARVRHPVARARGGVLLLRAGAGPGEARHHRRPRVPGGRATGGGPVRPQSTGKDTSADEAIPLCASAPRRSRST